MSFFVWLRPYQYVSLTHLTSAVLSTAANRYLGTAYGSAAAAFFFAACINLLFQFPVQGINIMLTVCSRSWTRPSWPLYSSKLFVLLHAYLQKVVHIFLIEQKSFSVLKILILARNVRYCSMGSPRFAVWKLTKNVNFFKIKNLMYNHSSNWN